MKTNRCIVCNEKRFNDSKVPKWVSIYTLKNYIRAHKSVNFTVCPKCRRLSLNKILSIIAMEGNK